MVSTKEISGQKPYFLIALSKANSPFHAPHEALESPTERRERGKCAYAHPATGRLGREIFQVSCDRRIAVMQQNTDDITIPLLIRRINPLSRKKHGRGAPWRCAPPFMFLVGTDGILILQRARCPRSCPRRPEFPPRRLLAFTHFTP